jgi:hypothetical protein
VLAALAMGSALAAISLRIAPLAAL